MKDTFIQGIFCEPVYKSSINRNISKTEINFLKKCSKVKKRITGPY